MIVRMVETALVRVLEGYSTAILGGWLIASLLPALALRAIYLVLQTEHNQIPHFTVLYSRAGFVHGL